MDKRTWKRNFPEQIKGAGYATNTMTEARSKLDASDNKDEWWVGFISLIVGFMTASIGPQNTIEILDTLSQAVRNREV